MKLQRERSRTDPKSGKVYHKWRLTPPEDAIRQLGWQHGEELAVEVQGADLVVRRQEQTLARPATSGAAMSSPVDQATSLEQLKAAAAKIHGEILARIARLEQPGATRASEAGAPSPIQGPSTPASAMRRCHAVLASLMDFFEEAGLPLGGEFEEYRAFGVRPFMETSPDAHHKAASFLLGKGIWGVILRGNPDHLQRMQDRFLALAKDASRGGKDNQEFHKAFHKDELLQVHMLLSQTRRYFEDSGLPLDGRFVEYDRLDCSPQDIHKIAVHHQRAVFHLGQGLLGVIARAKPEHKEHLRERFVRLESSKPLDEERASAGWDGHWETSGLEDPWSHPAGLSDMPTGTDTTAGAIAVVGCGGAGVDTVGAMPHDNNKVWTIAIGRDRNAVGFAGTDVTLKLGKAAMAQDAADIGRVIAEGYPEKVRGWLQHTMSRAKLAIILAAVDDPSSMGAAIAVADAAKKNGSTVVAFTYVPHDSPRSNVVHSDGIRELRQRVNSVILVDQFDSEGHVAGGVVWRLAETIDGICKMDLPGLEKMWLKSGDVAILQMEEWSLEDADAILERVSSSRFMDADPTTATRMLVQITGGDDLSRERAQSIAAGLGKMLAPGRPQVWGMQTLPQSRNWIRVTVILSGIASLVAVDPTFAGPASQSGAQGRRVGPSGSTGRSATVHDD